MNPVTGVKFISLASGSKGNCYFLATPHAQVLIDCGISLRRLSQALRALGVDYRRLDAAFITHTHTDHIKGLGMLLKHVPVRVYAHELLADELAAAIARQQAGTGNGRARAARSWLPGVDKGEWEWAAGAALAAHPGHTDLQKPGWFQPPRY